MDVCLDDIVIYSDAVEEHLNHVKKVVDTLHKNKFYLSAHKLQFFTEELVILGHVIDAQGIRMDPATKVGHSSRLEGTISLEKWNMPELPTAQPLDCPTDPNTTTAMRPSAWTHRHLGIP